VRWQTRKTGEGKVAYMSIRGGSENNIKLGIIGIGAMGKGLLYQASITAGIDTVAVCDIELSRCTDALHWLGLDYRLVSNAAEMAAAIEAGQVAVCADGELLAACSGLDAVIEASGVIIPAARFAIKALEAKNHLILMNSEIDLIFGPYLKHLAELNRVVCTSCDGDQYGAMKHIIDDLRSWGFELVMAGNIKGFLDRYANPTMIVEEADKRNLDYRACTSYTDGTKLNIEMALIANCIGMQTIRPGMLGPETSHVNEVLQVFDFKHLWQPGRPWVDYILGAEPGGGVFVVGYCDNEYQRDMLKYYKMGDGPYYLFYRHFHICHIEAMATVFDAVRKGTGLMLAECGFRTNVYSYAKKDLETGTILDGIGGYSCYGMIENLADNDADPGIPICLAENVVLRRAVKKDEKIRLADVIFDEERLDFKLYKLAVQIGGGIKQ